jgi:hypothetical protein
VPVLRGTGFTEVPRRATPAEAQRIEEYNAFVQRRRVERTQERDQVLALLRDGVRPAEAAAYRARADDPGREFRAESTSATQPSVQSNTAQPARLPAPDVKDAGVDAVGTTSKSEAASQPKPASDIGEQRSVPPAGGTMRVTITATEGEHSAKTSLGPIRKGQVITFEYVSGAWTAFPRADYPPGSPDDVPVAHYNILPLRLCESRDGKVTEIAVVPGGTKRRPFVYTADRGIANLVLNTSDKKPANNRGEVVYRVTIGP